MFLFYVHLALFSNVKILLRVDKSTFSNTSRTLLVPDKKGA